MIQPVYKEKDDYSLIESSLQRLDSAAIDLKKQLDL